MYVLHINGSRRDVDVPADMPLLWVLRDILSLNGTKYGCGIAQCGACTVHVAGSAMRSCVLPIFDVGEREVTTIEAVHESDAGRRVQQAWRDLEVVQCGYCQSGQIMNAVALLSSTPSPSDEEIATAMSGNICRCGTYVRIREAIKKAAGREFQAMTTIALAGSQGTTQEGIAGPPGDGAPTFDPRPNRTPTESLNESARPRRP